MLKHLFNKTMKEVHAYVQPCNSVTFFAAATASGKNFSSCPHESAHHRNTVHVTMSMKRPVIMTIDVLHLSLAMFTDHKDIVAIMKLLS